MKKTNQMICAGLLTVFPVLLFAQDSRSIDVQVQLHTPKSVTTKIMAVGFATGNTKRGSLGRITTKKGPADADYSFGIRTTDGQKISCGDAKLTRDSVVKLVYNGKTCHVAHIALMKKH